MSPKYRSAIKTYLNRSSRRLITVQLPIITRGASHSRLTRKLAAGEIFSGEKKLPSSTYIIPSTSRRPLGKRAEDHEILRRSISIANETNHSRCPFAIRTTLRYHKSLEPPKHLSFPGPWSRSRDQIDLLSRARKTGNITRLLLSDTRLTKCNTQ